MRKWGLLFTILLLPAWTVSVWAQSETVMDSLLSEKNASFGESVYLVMAAIKAVPETASVDEAVAAVGEQHWNITIPDAASPITLGQYSFLLMKAFKMQGGIMYRLFPGPRYAARELAFRRLISGDTSPYRTVSGAEVVQILGSVMGQEGGGS